MKLKIDKEKLAKALYKKAIGYDFEESVEEYSVDNQDGSLKKNKSRISKKHLPPDIPAMKALLSLCETNESKYDGMNEEQLLEERAKLLEELENAEN